MPGTLYPLANFVCWGHGAIFTIMPEFFYLLIYGIFFSDLGGWGGGGLQKKKALKMTS